MPTSPTSRTLKYFKSLDVPAGVVEKYNHHIKRRIDLFGFIDMIAVPPTGPVFIQVTSGAHVNNRCMKIMQECGTTALKLGQAGADIQVWGWRALKSRPTKWWAKRRRIKVRGGSFELEDLPEVGEAGQVWEPTADKTG